MARPKRFELLTPKFVVWCSIQLSYGRVPFKREIAAARHSYSAPRGLARLGRRSARLGIRVNGLGRVILC